MSNAERIRQVAERLRLINIQTEADALHGIADSVAEDEAVLAEHRRLDRARDEIIQRASKDGVLKRSGLL